MYYMGYSAGRLAQSPSPGKPWKLKKGETILKHCDYTKRWVREEDT